MVSYDGDMTAINYNRKRNVENLFTLAADHRIFQRNLPYRVYGHVYQKYCINPKFDVYGEIFSPGPKKNFTFPISLFLFIIANCYVDQCKPPLIMFKLYFLLVS